MTNALSTENHFSIREKYVYIALALLLWLYVALRAWLVPYTHDEVANFLHYLTSGFIWPNDKMLWDANNHILSTYLSRFSYLLLGSAEWALRLPAVIISGLYFVFCYKLAQKLANPLLRWALLLGLLFCHVVLEFFAFSRGYGISMALMLGGLYYTYQYLIKPSYGSLVLALILFILAVASNLNMLILLLLVIVYVFTKRLLNLKKEKNLLWHIPLTLAIVTAPIAGFAWYGFGLKQRGKLYYGSDDGFWGGTVTSLIDLISWEGNTAGKVIVVLLFIGLLLLIGLHLKRVNLAKILTPSLFFPFLLIGNIVASIVMYYLLHTLYQLDRTALSYFTLFILSLAFVLDSIEFSLKKQASYLLLAIMCFFPIQFIGKLNLTHSTLWFVDAPSKRFLGIMQKDADMQNHQNSTGGYHLRAFTFAYYNRQLADGFLNMVTPSSYTDGETDYQITNKKECEHCELYDSIAYDDISGLYLMKRKQLMKHENLLTIGDIHTEGELADGEFIASFRMDIDTFAGKDFELEYNWALDLTEQSRVWLVFELLDSNSVQLRYDFIGVNWIKRNFTGEPGNFHYSVLLPNVPDGTKTILTYMWNQTRAPMSIRNGEIKLNRLVEP